MYRFLLSFLFLGIAAVQGMENAEDLNKDRENRREMMLSFIAHLQKDIKTEEEKSDNSHKNIIDNKINLEREEEELAQRIKILEEALQNNKKSQEKFCKELTEIQAETTARKESLNRLEKQKEIILRNPNAETKEGQGKRHEWMLDELAKGNKEIKRTPSFDQLVQSDKGHDLISAKSKATKVSIETIYENFYSIGKEKPKPAPSIKAEDQNNSALVNAVAAISAWNGTKFSDFYQKIENEAITSDEINPEGETITHIYSNIDTYLNYVHEKLKKIQQGNLYSNIKKEDALAHLESIAMIKAAGNFWHIFAQNVMMDDDLVTTKQFEFNYRGSKYVLHLD